MKKILLGLLLLISSMSFGAGDIEMTDNKKIEIHAQQGSYSTGNIETEGKVRVFEDKARNVVCYIYETQTRVVKYNKLTEPGTRPSISCIKI